MAPKDMVTFLMPDGTEVSNDPRFGLEDALQDQLSSSEYTGDAGTPQDEFDAQTAVTRLASPQSSQPGVGENAVQDDPTKELHGPMGSDAQRIQVEDVKAAKEAGASPQETSVEDAEPVDSNERVMEVRKEKAALAEKARRAAEKLGDDGPGDPDKPYSEWSGNQLKAEALRRNAERDQDQRIDLTGVRKTKQLAELLEKDDTNQADGGATASGDPQ